MSPMTENERLAVVETEVRGLRADMVEVKHDLKTLISAVATLSAAENVSSRAALARSDEQGRVGTWVRWLLPAIFSFITLILLIAHKLSGG